MREVAIIGLGKMGGNLARQLIEKGWHVIGYNRTPSVTEALVKEGIEGAYSLEEVVKKMATPRVIWLMLPAGEIVDEHLFGPNGLAQWLEPGDYVIDGGNSFYKDAAPRAKRLGKINYLDVGTSGGPSGARNGACLMIGGTQEAYQYLEPLFRDVAKDEAYQFFPGFGAGHFVKMVHNGIEYGMMQALAEGFAILKSAPFDFNLVDVARIYDNGSVIESRLTHWLLKGLEQHGEELQAVSGTVKHTGEGEWTVKTAQELKVPAPVITESFQFRVQSADQPSYTGQILSALREQFGGHAIQ